MDRNDNLNMRNCGFFEPAATALKGHLGLQLMSTMAAEKPLFGGGGSRDQHCHQHHHSQQPPQHNQNHHGHPALMASSTNGALLNHQRIGGLLESSLAVDYMRDFWINYNREKYLNILPNHNLHHHSNYSVLPESSSAHSLQMLQMNNLPENDSVHSHPQLHDSCVEKDVSPSPIKKRGRAKTQADKSPKAKKAKRVPRGPRDEYTPSVQRSRAPKKSAEVMINGISMDISGIPIPVCTCTGAPQQCYRWGSGGWQSACCTTGMSMYPLPMSTKRRGARIAGRKMSIGAFTKLLEKLSSEAYNFSNPIDLKNYWAKHGTNKFVTIR